jgi:SPP1 family predicted phage head-tail adaptor
MDRSVAIQARTLSAPNALGEQIAIYTTFATVYGEKTELSGSQQLIAQQTTAQKIARFRIYWRTDVNTTCRIIVDGETYDVTYIAEVGRRQGLLLTAKALAS